MRERLDQLRMEFIDLPRPAQWLSGSVILISVVGTISIMLAALGSWWVDMSLAGHAAEQAARYKGYLESSTRLVSVLATYRAELDEFAYPDSGDSGRSGALLQQDLRRISESSGVVVSGSEVKEPVEIDGLVELRVQLNLSGPALAMDQLLAALQDATPLLFLERLEMQGPRQSRRRGGPPELSEHISAQLHILAYRVSEA